MENQDQFLAVKRKFIRLTYVSGVFVMFAAIMVFFTYGKEPYVQVGARGRLCVEIVSMLSLVVLLYSGGMLIMVPILKRNSIPKKTFQPRPKQRKS
jgi:hypothetical protein